MGIYSEYLDKGLNFQKLSDERKKQLKRIAQLRDSDVLVYAADLTAANAPISIDLSDVLPFKDQIAQCKSKSVDIIIETPGGFAEVVEDLIDLLRVKFEKVAVIIPGIAKSAGTIFAMGTDEILMGKTAALGPIDAQIASNNKRFSAEAFLEGLEKIKSEVIERGKLNPAYIPILQNISPGEIQHCENAQSFSKSLVTKWLSTYKFKNWETHKSTGKKVTDEEKVKRAEDIANILCKHSEWLTHGKSIKIADLRAMKLEIKDYTEDSNLEDAINRYYTLLRMTFESTNIYKVFETHSSQIFRFSGTNIPPLQNMPGKGGEPDKAMIDYNCPTCQARYKIQANLKKNVPLEQGAIAYPKNNTFKCTRCGTLNNLTPLRLQIEAQARKKIIL
ncbi:Clp protease ClpP [Roseivirga sp. 4D4]|uniref:SDH family Clp fold serine proteinase n=1 Tax=Roseivirga sp. 4D4 TaxID=1889784 RepID=UPI000853EEF9|nr:Clp protease ClpP [Roseivirga sp. 4D4]OEK02619.1 Clp protease ClpP [Roseivirga sp. 4D4]